MRQGRKVRAARILAKATDQQITDAGFVDVTGLAFGVTADLTYQYEFWVLYQSDDVAMGVLLGLNGPAKILLFAHTRKNDTEAIQTDYDTPLPNSADEPAADTNLLCVIRGVFTPSANGTFTLRLSKENVAGTATVKAGSHVKYRVLP